MGDYAIEAESLSKVYRIWRNPQDRFCGGVAGRLLQLPLPQVGLRSWLMRYHSACFEDFYALRQVSLRVPKGATVGIVGRNGSGKSTLLKLIAGTLQPTEGQIRIAGRVTALLELGAGFDPQFTGRDNVFLNASLLGLSRDETEARMEGILSFANIGKFVDRPVKTYSSGMMVRLAFAVQTALDPDILIVDEALSVGDAPFQRKCFARMEALREQGTTILFVSHDTGSVQNLCEHALFLHQGELISSSSPKDIVTQYQRYCFAPDHVRDRILADIRSGLLQQREEDKAKEVVEDAVNSREGHGPDAEESVEVAALFDPELVVSDVVGYESRGAVISEVSLLSLAGNCVNLLQPRHYYTYRYRVDFQEPCRDVAFAMAIKKLDGIVLGGARHANVGNWVEYTEDGSRCWVTFRFQCLLTPGVYLMNAGVEGTHADGERGYLHRLIDAYMFRVLPDDQSLATGQVDFQIEPEIMLLSPTTHES